MIVPHTRWLGRELRGVASTRSTNDDVLALARAGAAHGLVVIADEQTGGRGRLGRTWTSPPGQNLYLSALLRPELPPGGAPPITLAAAVAVAEALNESGVRASIKWPNDVLIMVDSKEKKVAGILTESVTRGSRLEAVVLGIGVNLNWRELPAELVPIATSVALATGEAVDRDAFAAALLARLERGSRARAGEAAPAAPAPAASP